jgi:hypothetical protein
LSPAKPNLSTTANSAFSHALQKYSKKENCQKQEYLTNTKSKKDSVSTLSTPSAIKRTFVTTEEIKQEDSRVII